MGEQSSIVCVTLEILYILKAPLSARTELVVAQNISDTSDGQIVGAEVNQSSNEKNLNSTPKPVDSTDAQHVSLPHHQADEDDKCCACDEGTAGNDTADNLHRENLKRLRKKKLAQDAKQATAAVSFILVLLMGAVLSTRMWRQNQHLPRADHSHHNQTVDTHTTAADLFARIKRFRKKLRDRPSRRKKRKVETEEMLLLGDCEEFHV